MYRFIFSIQMTLRAPDLGELRQLIAVLDRGGQSPHCRAVMPKLRVIDLRDGDRVFFEGERHEILAIRAFRDTRGPQHLTQEIDEGYLLKRS
jgi:hypothetical protein